MYCYLITYDIPDNGRRLKMANQLLNHGKRVQLSVFEVWLAKTDKQPLFERLNEILDPEEDSLRIYLLCSDCQKQAQAYGLGEALRPPELIIV